MLSRLLSCYNCSNNNFFLLTPLLLLILVAVQSHAANNCLSCFKSCRTLDGGNKIDAAECDCGEGGNVTTCTGEYCFAKVDVFHDEGTAVVQKGCITFATSLGCQYQSSSETVHCYCQGDRCNSRRLLNDFAVQPAPVSECCLCNEAASSKDGKAQVCPADGCASRCRGNYCVAEFSDASVQQGCGVGSPRLVDFLRIANYSSHAGNYICSRYEAGNDVVDGCTCTDPHGICNQKAKSKDHQRTYVHESKEDMVYCYSLKKSSAKGPLGKDVYMESSTCEGHFCFLSYTTSELVVESVSQSAGGIGEKFEAHSLPHFELIAGCIKTDQVQSVNEGCTVEYNVTKSTALHRHCVCRTHLCNYWTLAGVPEASGEAPSTPLSAVAKSSINAEDDRKNGVPDAPAFSSVAVVRSNSASARGRRTSMPPLEALLHISAAVVLLSNLD